MRPFVLRDWQLAWSKLKYKYSRLVRFFAEINFQSTVLLINSLLLLMIVFSFVLMTLALAQVQLQQGVEPDGFSKAVTDTVFEWMPEKVNASKLKLVDKAAVLGSIISAAGAVVTAVFSLVAWFYSWVSHKAQEKKGMVESQRVYDEAGLDDVMVMFDAYRSAKEIHVIGGDFSWLKENGGNSAYEEMRKLVVGMANEKKINLYSYSNDESVKSTIGSKLHASLKGRIKFVPKLKGIRASLVECPYGRTLLYKVHSDKTTMHICQISDRTPDGRLLLEQFKVLIDTL